MANSSRTARGGNMTSRSCPVDVDVVVAGAGGAGLSAALRAAEFGLSVAVFETTEHFRSGNNTSMSTSMIPAGGSRWQRAERIDDSLGLSQTTWRPRLKEQPSQR